MKQKVVEKLKAIELRKRGHSLNEIIIKLGIAKSSASMWVRNVPLTISGRQRLLTKIKLGQRVAAENKQKRTLELLEQYRIDALKKIDRQMGEGVTAEIICSLLYWCEGAKSFSMGVRFTNSDPSVIKTFLTLFRKSFKLDERKLRVGLHLHEYHDFKLQIDFWSRITGIGQSQFIRPYLKPHTAKRIRENYPGCATIYYHSNDVAKRLLATAKAFLEMTGV